MQSAAITIQVIGVIGRRLAVGLLCHAATRARHVGPQTTAAGSSANHSFHPASWVAASSAARSPNR